MRHPVRKVLTSIVALVALAGCSEDAARDSGAEMIEIQGTDVVFALPDGWVELDPDEAIEATKDEDLMAELVERHGPDTERLGPVHLFITFAAVPPHSESAFIASAKGVENGRLSQMVVEVLDQDDLPSTAEEEQRYRDHGPNVEDLHVAEIDTGVGPGVLATMSPPIGEPEDPDVQWAIVTVDAGADVVEFFFVTGDRAETEQLASDLADSLERTP